MAYPWFRTYQDKYQSGVAFRVAILGDSDFSSSDSWVSKLRSQLTTRNPNCIVTDYSVVGLTAANALSVVSDIVDDTADVCLVCLGISDFSVIDHGQFGLNCVAIGDALNTGGIYPIFVQGNDIQTVTGYQNQDSEWFCMYMNALDQVAVYQGREYHTLNGYSQFRHLKEQGALSNYLTSNTRMNAAGHDLLLGKITEWFFAPEIFIWKNNSQDNYVLGAREATILPNPSGDGDYWYSTGGALRHATLSGPNWATVGPYTSITYTNTATLNAAYPAIFINPRDGWYYLFGGGTIELYPDNFYLWKSPNGVTGWQYANDGSPVLTRGTSGPWSHIWNGTILVELKDSAANDVFHLLIDGSPMDRDNPELNNYGMLYASATLGNNFDFDANKSAGYVKQNWGTPQVLHVPERNAVLVFYMDLGYIIDSPITNGFDTPGRNGFCTIRVGWCDLSNGYSAMSTPANWHESPLLNIQEANEHITDPTICVMPSGKDSKLCLGYYWGQSNSRNIFTYSDYTTVELYDLLVNSAPSTGPIIRRWNGSTYEPITLHAYNGSAYSPISIRKV